MKDKSESQIVKEVLRALNYIPGVRVWRQNTGAIRFGADSGKGGSRFVRFGTPGAADLTGIGPGGVRLEIECKRPKQGQRCSQKCYEELVISYGAVYIVVHDAVEAVEMVHAAIQARK